MTRFLSKSLQAPEPFFRLGLRKLEAANGHPGTDIRLSTEVIRDTKDKLRQLGLDPEDTTPAELYHLLQERIKSDDKRLNRTLRTKAATYVSAEANVVDGMIHTLKELPDSKRCFALKPSALKAVLKIVPPKKAMKQLGYRSLDSFLKHEPPVSVLAAAYLCEDSHWHKRLLNQYEKLKPGDFENRNIMIIQPDSRHWSELAENVVSDKKHNILCFKEFGALVFLPLPRDVPPGTTTASLSLALHELNEIRSSATFLRLCQVRPDFGKIVRKVAASEPRLNSELFDETVPWHLIQHYYARLAHRGQETAFEPHLEFEDMAWHAVEKTLSAIEPSLDFWRGSSHLGLLDDSGPVSLNIVDAAINACNGLPFERRVAHYGQRSLWHELLLRYLKPQTVQQAIARELQPELAKEMATS